MKDEEKILYFLQTELRVIFEMPFFYQQVDTSKKYGITLEVRSKENGYDNIPHCHARYNNKCISISLIDYSILEQNGVKENMQRKAIEMVKRYKNELDELWTKFHGKIEL